MKGSGVWASVVKKLCYCCTTWVVLTHPLAYNSKLWCLILFQKTFTHQHSLLDPAQRSGNFDILLLFVFNFFTTIFGLKSRWIYELAGKIKNKSHLKINGDQVFHYFFYDGYLLYGNLYENNFLMHWNLWVFLLHHLLMLTLGKKLSSLILKGRFSNNYLCPLHYLYNNKYN